jgi:hypothetical protein
VKNIDNVDHEDINIAFNLVLKNLVIDLKASLKKGPNEVPRRKNERKLHCLRTLIAIN